MTVTVNARAVWLRVAAWSFTGLSEEERERRRGEGGAWIVFTIHRHFALGVRREGRGQGFLIIHIMREGAVARRPSL